MRATVTLSTTDTPLNDRYLSTTMRRAMLSHACVRDSCSACRMPHASHYDTFFHGLRAAHGLRGDPCRPHVAQRPLVLLAYLLLLVRPGVQEVLAELAVAVARREPARSKKGRSQKAGTQRPQRSGTGLVLLRSATAACRRVWPTWQVSSTKLRVTPQPPETTLRAVRSAVHPVCHIRATSPWSLSQRQAKPPAKGVDALQKS